MEGHFGARAQAFPVFNGTGANVLALQSALPRWAAVITAASAHINYDETGAPEKVGGSRSSPSRPPTASSPRSRSPLRWSAAAASTMRSRWA